MALALLIGSAVVLAEFTLLFPTSDYRARLYGMLWSWVWPVGVIFFGMVVIPPALIAVVTGWRKVWTGVGVLVGGLVVMAAVYLHLFSYTVWLHDEDIPSWGAAIRLMLSAYIVLVAGMAALWYRRGIMGLSTAGPFFRS